MRVNQMHWLFMARRWCAQKKSTVFAVAVELTEFEEIVMKFVERRYTISEPDELRCFGASLAADSYGSRE